MMEDFYAIDLFSGGGGLSVGLKAAGFKILAAIEKDNNAFTTYKRNHPEVHCFNGDIRDLSEKDILMEADGNSIDLIAGCPPCQGFTSLTSKYRREDPRNNLIQEMARLILAIRPRAVMLENVPQLAIKGKSLFAEFCNNLRSAGYNYEYGVLDAANYGVPQSRKRLVFVAGLGFDIKLPSPTHSRDVSNGLEAWVPVKKILTGLGRSKTLEQIKKAGLRPQDHNWHVVRTLSEENRQRLKWAKPGKSWECIPEDIRPKCHRDGYAGFSNVYGRMDGDEVSPTITGGCTTLSKGRFGHPSAQRTVSVREAARIQTFPDDYVFDTPYMDTVCNIIGNAFPCLFAQRIAEECYSSLKMADSTSNCTMNRPGF